MDMKSVKSNLDNLPDKSLEQELLLVTQFLAQLPYATSSEVVIEVRNIPKKQFQETHTDWWQRILEIMDRFVKLGVISKYKPKDIGGNIGLAVNKNKEPLAKYQKTLEKELRKRKVKGRDMPCELDGTIFYLHRGEAQNPLSINFSTIRGNNQTFDLMDIFLSRWKENYLTSGSIQCLVPRASIVSQMIKRGHQEFNTKRLGDAKNYLIKKLATEPRIAKRVKIKYRSDSNSYLFEITSSY